jgi:O-antigen ligase
VINRLQRLLWALLLISLPITSLPFLSRILGGAMVAPPALPLAGILFAIGLLPTLRKGKLSPLIPPLLAFTLAALTSTLLAFFMAIPPFKQISYLNVALTAFFTLACGLCFYLVSATNSDLQSNLRWINAGGILLLAWSLLQAIAWRVIHDSYPDWMWQVQGLISSSGVLYNWRATGLAYEPSWLGHQLTMLYLPLWLACTLTGFSAHPKLKIFRLPAFSLENLLLPIGVIVLYFSYARGSLVSFLIMLALTALYLSQNGINKLSKRLSQRFPHQKSGLFRLGLWSAFIILAILIAAGALTIYLRSDLRMQDALTLLLEKESFNNLAHKLFFGERAIFWQAGLDIFSQHPIFGVGLGNAGFFFPQVLPPIGWTMAEPHKMYVSNALPNTLSLWIRLLSETGALGFGLFISWLYLLLSAARRLLHCDRPILRTYGWAGLFVLAGLLMEGFSIDTFALPYYWFSLGWLTAASDNYDLDRKQALEVDSAMPLAESAAKPAG